MSFESGESRLIELPPKKQYGEGRDRAAEEDEAMLEAWLDEAQPSMLDELDDDHASRRLRRGELFHHYEIIKFIGHGGMSDVYVAQRMDEYGGHADSMPVALKILHATQHAHVSLLDLLEREAEICHAIDSPHVVRIYEYGLSEEGRAFIALELLLGEELFERRKRLKIIPLKQTTELIAQALRGLEAIHDQGVVHRDLKTENIFLVRHNDGRETVKIIDLGLARYLDDDPHDPLLREPGRIWGTPHYLSPEQTRSPVVDHRSDLYAIGVILYECATGAYPFDGETPYAILIAHQEQKPPMMPSTLDHELCQIIYKALAKRPSERWSSAKEMRLALEEWIDHTSWDNALPGLFHPSHRAAPDELFADLLAERGELGPDESSPMLPPAESTDRFGAKDLARAEAAAARHTPSSGAAKVLRRARTSRHDAASLKQARRTPTKSFGATSLNLERATPGGSQAAPSAPVLRAVRGEERGEERAALRLPDRVEPLLSSPIELSETKKKPPSERLISRPLLKPEPEPLPELRPEGSEPARLMLAAMVALGAALIVALLLLLFWK